MKLEPVLVTTDTGKVDIGASKRRTATVWKDLSACEEILSELIKHRDSGPFVDPVSKKLVSADCLLRHKKLLCVAAVECNATAGFPPDLRFPFMLHISNEDITVFSKAIASVIIFISTVFVVLRA